MCGPSIRLQIFRCPQVGLRQLLRRLEREKGEVEWQLKECEWRLDQEATVSWGGCSLHLCMGLIELSMDPLTTKNHKCGSVKQQVDVGGKATKKT